VSQGAGHGDEQNGKQQTMTLHLNRSSFPALVA
jgi:hypothetical protein